MPCYNIFSQPLVIVAKGLSLPSLVCFQNHSGLSWCCFADFRLCPLWLGHFHVENLDSSCASTLHSEQSTTLLCSILEFQQVLQT